MENSILRIWINVSLFSVLSSLSIIRDLFGVSGVTHTAKLLTVLKK